MSVRGLLLALLLASAPAVAQDVERDVSSLRTDFEYGKYEEVLARAQTRLDQGVDDPKLLVEIHKLAGVSAFNLGKQSEADRHLSAMLRIDPDYTLDPFVYPPPVIEFHDKLRRSMGPELERIRQVRALEQARRRAAEAEAERVRIEEERRRLLSQPRRVTTETIERRSFFVNLVPFGAGQFQQGRTQLGLWLASLQGAMAATSILAYWAHEFILVTRTLELPGTINPGSTKYPLEVRGIPPERAQEAANWRLIKYISGAAFYGLYAYGVIDALIRHQDTIVTTTTVEVAPDAAPSSLPPLTPGVPKTLQHVAPGASVNPFLFPTPGGAGAGLEVRF